MRECRRSRPLRLDGEVACVAGEPLGGFGADRPGAFQQRGRVVAEVHDQGGGTAPNSALARAAGVAGEGDEGVGGRLLPLQHRACLLVGGALGFGDVPDGLFEGRALLQRQAAADGEFSPAACPGHAQGAPLVERVVVLELGRGERARCHCDLAGRLADRHTRQLGIAGGCGELGGCRDLVERQRARAERLVECRQATQRLAGAGDALGAAVVAACDLRQPLGAGGAARRAPILLVVGLAHDLRQPLCQTRLLLADRAHLTATRVTTPLERLVDRPIQRSEHTFDPTSCPAAKVCRNCAEIQPLQRRLSIAMSEEPRIDFSASHEVGAPE